MSFKGFRPVSSAPGSRSSSFKHKPCSSLRRNRSLKSCGRSLSLPSSSPDDPRVQKNESILRRVRSFKTTSRGIINNGDSFKQIETRSFSNASTSVDTESIRRFPRTSSTGSDMSLLSDTTMVSADDVFDVSHYKVGVYGAEAVGKTSVITQCLTSEFKSSYDTSNYDEEEEDKEKTMCVLLNEEESLLEFVERVTVDDSDNVDAHVVVFSVTCRRSFKAAVDIMRRLAEASVRKTSILVGNKVDLARQRKVQPEEIRSSARKYKCKCIETSTALNHNIDNLVVGVLTQIRLKSKTDSNDIREKTNTTAARFRKLKLLVRCFLKLTKQRSCDNLLH